MPRVLRIINRFNLGGPTHNAAYLTRYLPDEFETLLVGGPQGPHEEGSGHILRSLGVEAMVLPEMQREVSPWQDHTAYRRIKQIIKDYKPDVVHTHAAKAGAVGRLAAHDLGVKAVVHTFHGHVFHSYFGPVRTAVFKNIERFLAQRTSRIIAISEKQKQELVQEHRVCRADKVAVIPLGFDLGKFRADQAAKRALFRRVYGLADDELAVVIVGRLVPVKNHALFLKGIKHVQQRTGKRVRAFIVGDGEDRTRIEHQVADLGLSLAKAPGFNGHGFGHGVNGTPVTGRADVTFTSWINEIDLAYAGADIVALTSYNEGTPVSLIEAQAAGKPVVSTRVGGIENVVQEGTTGLLCPNNDVRAFGEGLLRLVENDALRTSMSAAGWDQVGARYHYARLVGDMATLYTGLLA
ncbi:MAG: glycosyltransferase [Flavobacteriales bacterium]|nr:glycosyltransferase [Flavobacteriales bacterium]MBP9079865.1 glycosyltransferase [Flavobacteriales bacterium]